MLRGKNCARHKQTTLTAAVPLSPVFARVLVLHSAVDSWTVEVVCMTLLEEVVHTQLADCWDGEDLDQWGVGQGLQEMTGLVLVFEAEEGIDRTAPLPVDTLANFWKEQKGEKFQPQVPKSPASGYQRAMHSSLVFEDASIGQMSQKTKNGHGAAMEAASS